MDSIEDHLEELKSFIEETSNRYVAGPELPPDSWIGPMRDKILTMFKSPLKDEYRLELFKATSSMCLCFPVFTWISQDSHWKKEEIDMFSLLARLTLNEIQILIPLVERHILVGDDVAIENNKIVERSANHLEYDMLACCFVILENVIQTLVSERHPQGSNLQDKIDIEQLSTLLVHLKEVMVKLVDYLHVVHKNWNNLVEPHTNEKQYSCAQATIRIAAVWCSEEPIAFVCESQQYMIDLFVLCLGDSLSKTQVLSNLSHLILLALHALCMDNDDLLHCLRESGIDILEEYRRRCRKKAHESSKPDQDLMEKYSIVEDIIRKLNR